MTKFIVIICLFTSLFAASTLATQGANVQKTLTMCIDHYPPLQIIHPDGRATGENIELTRMLFATLGYRLEFTGNVPFKRCLQWLKEGDVDLMTGLLDAPERQQDYHMFLYDDHTVKSFFVLHDGPQITGFSQLSGLNIAVVRGARQFQRFDEAPAELFSKTYVSSLSAAFGMLSRGRVDAVVCTDYYGNNVINSHPEFKSKIVKSPYEVVDGTKVYIALSRKSEYADHAALFARTANEMYQSGKFKQFVQDFQARHPEYY